MACLCRVQRQPAASSADRRTPGSDRAAGIEDENPLVKSARWARGRAYRRAISLFGCLTVLSTGCYLCRGADRGLPDLRTRSRPVGCAHTSLRLADPRPYLVSPDSAARRLPWPRADARTRFFVAWRNRPEEASRRVGPPAGRGHGLENPPPPGGGLGSRPLRRFGPVHPRVRPMGLASARLGASAS